MEHFPKTLTFDHTYCCTTILRAASSDPKTVDITRYITYPLFCHAPIITRYDYHVNVQDKTSGQSVFNLYWNVVIFKVGSQMYLYIRIQKVANAWYSKWV